jgi:hypothetical protein
MWYRNTLETTVSVSPLSTTVATNQTFEVNIEVSDVADLYGWEFKLGYNASLLELVNVIEGVFLNSNRDTYFVPKNMSTDGYLLAGCTSLRNVTGVSGDGTLATVEFRAKTLGSCTLNLYDTKLVNSEKQLVGHDELDGTVTVVDITSPAIEILSPQNLTCCSSLVPLTFTVYDYSPISWIGYSLDDQPNTTITGNTIISVENGTHRVVVYANDTFGNMGHSQIVYFSVNSSLYAPWETSFIGLDEYPMVGFTAHDGRLYAISNNNLYIYDGTSWNVLEAPTYATSLMPYGNKLVIGGQGGLYSYNGSSYGLIFPVSTYIKALGVYNNRLYAGTILDNPPKLYYCNGSADNPSDWYVDTDFSAVLSLSGAFGSIDSFGVYDSVMYVGSGGKLYSFNGASWSIAASYDDVYAFLDMQVYNGKLYLATRDQGWRKPLYLGGTGFSGRVIEFDGENWTTVFYHDYWIYSLEEYDGKLYAGTANKILTYNGTGWETSFSATEGAYYAISMINYDGKIYVGMGNGYMFADPEPLIAEHETIVVPEFPSFLILALFMITTLLAILFHKRKRLRW